MLTPFSPGVLFTAAVISSPALWSAFADGTMEIDVALTRYLITVLIVWALLSAARSYVLSAHQHTRRAADEAARAEAAAAASADPNGTGPSPAGAAHRTSDTA